MFRAGVLLLLIITIVSILSCNDSSTPTPQPTITQEPGPTGEPDPSPTPVMTPDDNGTPTISGVPILPDLEVDTGDLAQVILYDLAWNEIATDTDSDPNFSFNVESGNNYILIADYSNGVSLGAVTPSVTGYLEQDVSVDTEIAMSLIILLRQLNSISW